MWGTLFRYGEQQLKFRAASVLKRERALQPGYRKETETEQLQTPDNSNGCFCSVCLSVCRSTLSVLSVCPCCCVFVAVVCLLVNIVLTEVCCFACHSTDLKCGWILEKLRFHFGLNVSFPRNRCSETPLNCSFWCCGVLFLVKATTWFG